MKIAVSESPEVDDIEITIVCPRMDSRVQQIIAAANALDRKLVGVADGILHIVATPDVLYIENVGGRTFIYLADKVLESKMTLPRIEESLQDTEFVRATRQMLVNMTHVRGIKPYLNARLELILTNDEHVIVSRQFAATVRNVLGIKG